MLIGRLNKPIFFGFLTPSIIRPATNNKAPDTSLANTTLMPRSHKVQKNYLLPTQAIFLVTLKLLRQFIILMARKQLESVTQNEKMKKIKISAALATFNEEENIIE